MCICYAPSVMTLRYWGGVGPGCVSGPHRYYGNIAASYLEQCGGRQNGAVSAQFGAPVKGGTAASQTWETRLSGGRRRRRRGGAPAGRSIWRCQGRRWSWALWRQMLLHWGEEGGGRGVGVLHGVPQADAQPQSPERGGRSL